MDGKNIEAEGEQVGDFAGLAKEGDITPGQAAFEAGAGEGTPPISENYYKDLYAKIAAEEQDPVMKSLKEKIIDGLRVGWQNLDPIIELAKEEHGDDFEITSDIAAKIKDELDNLEKECYRIDDDVTAKRVDKEQAVQTMEEYIRDAAEIIEACLKD